MTSDAPPPLEYGKPKRPVSASRVFAGLFGLLAGIAALLIGMLGIWAMIDALFFGYRADRVAHAGQATICLLIATVFTLAAVRWCRHAFRSNGARNDAAGG